MLLDADKALDGLKAGRFNLSNRQVLLTDDNDYFIASYKYDPDINFDIKLLPIRKFNLDGTKRWFIPTSIENIKPFLDFCRKHRFVLRPAAYERTYALLESIARRASASREQDADISIPRFQGELLPFQRASVAYGIHCDGRVIYGDEQGLGKTPEALATIEHFNAYPAVVVCQSTLRYQWAGECEKFIPHRSVEVIDNAANHPPSYNAEIAIISYDLLKLPSQWYLDKNLPIKPGVLRARPHFQHLTGRQNESLILDEIHLVKNHRSQRGQACEEFSKHIIPSDRAPQGVKIGTTGTLILNRPIEVVQPLRILNRLEDMGGFWNFTQRYCDPEINVYGFKYDGASNTDELHAKLRSVCYVRHEKKEVYPDLPPVRQTRVPITIDNKKAYDKCEKFFTAYVREIYGDEKADRLESVGNAKTFMQIEELSKLAIAGKMHGIVSWINDYLDATDDKLIVFAHHKNAQRGLYEEIKTMLFKKNKQLKVTTLFAGEPDIERNKKAFNYDPDTRIIVVSEKSGGTGHNLTGGKNMLICELPWTPSETSQYIARAYGRISDMHGVNVYYPMGRGTIDYVRWQIVMVNKRKITSSVISGKAGVTKRDVERELVTYYMNLEKEREMILE